jgi:hypothetical protein
MKVKVIDPSIQIKIEGLVMNGGGVYELDEDTAKKLINDGFVVEVEEKNENKNA